MNTSDESHQQEVKSAIVCSSPNMACSNHVPRNKHPNSSMTWRNNDYILGVSEYRWTGRIDQWWLSNSVIWIRRLTSICKKDKRSFVEEMATKERGTLSGVYKITKWLCGGNNNQLKTGVATSSQMNVRKPTDGYNTFVKYSTVLSQKSLPILQ